MLIDAPAHAQAQRILLRITTDRSGQESIFEQAVAPGKRFTIANLSDSTYFAFFTAIDRNTFESKPIGPLPLSIRTIPAAPLIASPKTGAILWGKHSTIEWLESEQAHHYTLQLAADAAFKELIDEQEVTTAHYTTPELKPGTYYFRVQTVTADTFATLFSIPLTWRLLETPDMAGMKATSDTNATLQWPIMAEGWTYDLQLADDKAFKSLIVDRKGLTGTSYTLTQKLPAATYYVRLRGVADNEPATPWTPTQNMTVKRGPLGWEELLIGVVFLGLILL